MTASADEPHVGLVVEGRGDLNAVPLLLRKHLIEAGVYTDILGKPVPFHGKGNATADGGVEGHVATAGLRPGCVGVLVVLDADSEPSCIEGPVLLARTAGVVAVPVCIALAERDFEDWLYASVETQDLGHTEAFDVAKNGGAVIERLLAPVKYIKPTWQPRLTARVDLPTARGRSRSLDRMLSRFDSLAALI